MTLFMTICSSLLNVHHFILLTRFCFLLFSFLSFSSCPPLFGVRVAPQACQNGNSQHLEHLLFYGADSSSQNASGNTALHICALYNKVFHEAHTKSGLCKKKKSFLNIINFVGCRKAVHEFCFIAEQIKTWRTTADRRPFRWELRVKGFIKVTEEQKWLKPNMTWNYHCAATLTKVTLKLGSMKFFKASRKKSK